LPTAYRGVTSAADTTSTRTARSCPRTTALPYVDKTILIHPVAATAAAAAAEIMV
jgi:hypothetical protein